MLRTSLLQATIILYFIIPPADPLAKGLSTETLIQAQVIFRHGNRNPTKTYPTDPYKDEATFWPEGYGELTELGKEQQFNLGVFLRKRYDGFLNKRYNKSQITVKSSDKDRTIMSAQATLSGLYTPENHATSWNPYVDWQLVPVHTIPRSNDSFLDMKAPCPKFLKDYEEFYRTSDFVRSLEAEHLPMIEYVRTQMGLADDTTLSQLLTYQDTLLVQNQRGLKFPDWLNQTIFEELSSLRYFRYEVETFTPEFKRLRGGPMLKELFENIQNKSKDAKQFHLYSAHEETIGAVMNTLGIFNHLPPPYSAALIFELHKLKQRQHYQNDVNEYVLQISYFNETQSEPYIMEIPGCDQLCSLKTLKTLIDRYIPLDWLQECELPALEHFPDGSKKTNQGNITDLSISLAGVVLLLVAILIVRKISKGWIRKSTEQTPLRAQMYPHMESD